MTHADAIRLADDAAAKERLAALHDDACAADRHFAEAEWIALAVDPERAGWFAFARNEELGVGADECCRD